MRGGPGGVGSTSRDLTHSSDLTREQAAVKATQCVIEGCAREDLKARGMCEMHYLRAWRGKPLLAPPAPRGLTTEERFWSKVDKSAGPDGCWLWTAALDEHGYGMFAVETKPPRTCHATRYSWQLAHGYVPPSDMEACHHCDTPACVNPTHLFLGTHGDNMRDMRAKGRHFYAARTHCKHGHEFTPENTKIRYQVDGVTRICLTCRKRIERKRDERVKRERRAAV